MTAVRSDSSGIMNKLPDARAFNPHLCAATDKLKILIAEVLQQMEGYEAYYQLRKRARRPADAENHARIVEAVICDLCVLELTRSHSALHVPLTNRVLNTGSRYKGRVLVKALKDVLRVMAAEEMNFLSYEKGKSIFTKTTAHLTQAPAGGQQTTFWAGPKLLSRIERFQIGFEDIGQSLEEEVIVLRDEKTRSNVPGLELEYEETDETLRLRAEMRRINASLAGANISCRAEHVNPSERRLRRIFNNGAFGQGGRLYGGFWQGMTSGDRQEHILIDDDAIVELDYGQMSVMLYYAVAGLQPPEGDLYDLSEHGISFEHRKGVKKVVQAIINSETLPGRYPTGTKALFPKSLRFCDLLKAIEAKHRGIFASMISGVGMQMFRLESDILVGVLLELQEQGVVALPIHDAVLVADEHKEVAREIMIAVFRRHTGLTPAVALA